jgi:hypothetical protein
VFTGVIFSTMNRWRASFSFGIFLCATDRELNDSEVCV